LARPKKGARRLPSDPKIAKKKKQIKLYFNEGTQKAIEEFQAAETDKEKNDIYTKDILPAFEKLSENLIFIHKFSSLHESYEDLKNDCVTFLYETLYKFDPSRGTKAFSYFNVVAKNFLIIKSKQKTAALRRSVSIEDKKYFSDNEIHSFQENNIADAPEASLIKRHETAMIFDMIKHLKGEAKSDNEKSCIAAINSLFENANDLEFLNKRAVFVYLREMSGLSPKQLTTTISNLKKKYRGLKEKDEFRIFFE
jgi:hypothetical protein|tara:strand:+ start:1182 stop:1940 length:759 start_codon:yes stop_codon:yes gene_type:complete